MIEEVPVSTYSGKRKPTREEQDGYSFRGIGIGATATAK